jgi:hypothetical protein
MEYTITFTPQSIAEHFGTTTDFVEEYWEYFENYLENFHYNWMSEVLWEDAETILCDEINRHQKENFEEFPSES